MTDEYKIEKSNTNEIGAIARLYSRCFGREESVDFFKWRYLENPAGQAVCLVARHNKDIVGSCAMIPENFYVFGEERRLYKCCDLMVDSGHRNHGLAKKLIGSSAEYLKQSGPIFLYTLSGASTHLFLKNHWLKLGNFNQYFKHRAQLKIKFIFRNVEYLYKKGILRTISSVRDICKDYIFKIDNTDIHIAKDEKYLLWRLGDPRYKYKIIGYYENNTLRGFIIYNNGIGGNDYIIDMEIASDDSRVKKALLDAIEFSTYKSGHKLIMALALENSSFQKLISINRYMRNPFRRGPLPSIRGLHVLIDSSYDAEALKGLHWNVYSSNYDDI